MIDPKRKKVLCPIEKDGKTYWRHLGSAYVNKDNSINVYMDCTPLNWNGKLQVRDWDEPGRQAAAATLPDAPIQYNLRPVPADPGELRADDTPF